MSRRPAANSREDSPWNPPAPVALSWDVCLGCDTRRRRASPSAPRWLHSAARGCWGHSREMPQWHSRCPPGELWGRGGFLLKQGTSGRRYPRSLTICRLLNVSQFGGCSVGGESDEVERLKTQILQNRYPWLQIHLLLLVCWRGRRNAIITRFDNSDRNLFYFVSWPGLS